MALLVTPASAIDMLDALDDSGGGSAVRGRARFGRMARQIGDGVALTVRDEAGALVICGGLYPEGDHAEAWFAVGPALKANVLLAVRLWRLMLEAVGGDAAPLKVVAYTDPAGVAGGRLAALFGFRDDGVVTDRAAVPLRAWSRTFP